MTTTTLLPRPTARHDHDPTRHFEARPAVRSTVSPIIVSSRWAAVMFATVFATELALEGDLNIVASLTLCLFITTWRTALPLVLGSASKPDRVVAVTDCLLLGAAVGWSGSLVSPFIFCAMAAVAVAALGWGGALGWAGLGAALVGMAATSGLAGTWLTLSDPMALAAALGLVGAALLFTLLRRVLLRSEATRRRLGGHSDALAETSDLLTMLNSVARTLPCSLSPRDAIDSAREQIVSTFHPTVICLVEYNGVDQRWVPKLAEGCVLSPASRTEDLPPALAAVALLDEARVVSNLQLASEQGIARGSRSGLYVRLSTQGRTVGLLGLEHRLPDHFGSRDVRLLDRLADVLALTLDNARSFGRLRSLGGEDERSRIARDLHDRLGQWLTHISLELERILSRSGDSSVELTRLYNDVQSALDELRDTLRQLRSGVSADRSLAEVGRDLTERFIERTEIDATWNATDPTASLPVPIEQELLRILQESLTNTELHSRATKVQATWEVSDGAGTLTVSDNGVGFDADRGVRDSATGWSESANGPTRSAPTFRSRATRRPGQRSSCRSTHSRSARRPRC